MPARADLFDPTSLAALGRIEIVARWVVDGFVSGLHRSPRKGFSSEFSDHRPYQPGEHLGVDGRPVLLLLDDPAATTRRDADARRGVDGQQHPPDSIGERGSSESVPR